MGLARLHGRTRHFVEEKVATFSRGLRPVHFLWLCAIVPFFILPALVGLIWAVAAMRRSPDQIPPVNFEWIAIVSAVNLIVSGLILYKFHFSPTEVIGFAASEVRALLQFLSGLLSGTPAGPRTTPI
jgi:hypothetical protein